MILINDEIVDYTLFPNMEMLVHTDFFKALVNADELKIEYTFDGNESLLHLYFILAHIQALYCVPVELIITYMPYSRMDRSQNGSCFTLAHVVKLITSVLKPTDRIEVIEPHSSETLKQFIYNGRSDAQMISVIPYLAQEVMHKHPDINVVCYPDKGARLRYAKASFGKDVVYCDKKRDFDTGNIVGLTLVGVGENPEKMLSGATVLIVDDLCSRGGTFYHTANRLREAGAVAVFLAVCHMEQNVVTGELVKDTSPINHVYCTDTMSGSNNLGQDKISVLSWKGLLGLDKCIKS